MMRIPVFLTTILLLLMVVTSAGADELSAIEIFDGMIHYESDQLTTTASTRDYFCAMTETTVRTGIGAREIIDKEYYFMVPTFQLQLIDGQPVFYFDDDLLIVLLESVELQKLRDAEIDGVNCYVIKSIPKDPAFARYNRTYYVAQDDFRHVRTIAEHATYELDNIHTIIDYTYDSFENFTLLSHTVAETRDENDNLIATVTTDYTNYEFGLGLSLAFYMDLLEDTDINIPLN